MRWLLFFILGSPGLAGAQKPPSAAQKESFTRFVKLAPWSQKQNMVDLIQPAIALRPKSLPADTLPAGAAKYGGRPDLPDGWTWPEFDGRPMAFFAQFDLAQIARMTVDSTLPAQGWLYFFSWFTPPAERNGTGSLHRKDWAEYRVLWFRGRREELKRRDFPERLPPEFRFDATRFNLTHSFGLPGWNDWRIERQQLPPQDINRLADFSGVYGVEEDHLLGYAYPIQGDPCRDWSLAYLGLDPANLLPDQQQAVQLTRGDFIHLLSFELDPTFKTLGRAKAYWGIRRQDLSKRDFSKVVLVLQGT